MKVRAEIRSGHSLKANHQITADSLSVDSTNCEWKIFGGKKNSRKFQKAKLEFAALGNYLKRIYIVFTTIC